MCKETTFTAIDFETANHKPYSICQIGLIRVENGRVTREIDILVQPPDNYYHYIFPGIHGITPEMTKEAPLFIDIWPKIKPFIQNQHVVAHNMAFDRNCMINTLNYYKLALPNFTDHCTYRIYGEALDRCCKKYKVRLNHHNALSDAMACAELFLLHLNGQ